MKAKSISGKSLNEIKVAINRCCSDGFSPTLAIGFFSIHQDRNEICSFLKEEGMDVVGATSSGEFIDNYQSKGESAILLLDISQDYYSIILQDIKEKSLEESVQGACQLVLGKITNPAFITLTTCINEQGEIFNGTQMVKYLVKSCDNNTEIFGGMAGADGKLIPSWVFTEDQSTNEGFILLALDKDKIELNGVAISGWKPLGKIRTVTKCVDGWLYTIDDQPALDMYLRYLGESLDQEQGGSSSFVDNISIFHPFICLDNGDPELRTPMFIDKDKNAIMLDYPIPEGGKFQFTIPPDFDIVETVLEKAKSLKKSESTEADALLVFSCLGRLNALGPMATMENDGLHEIWNAPMAGFFTYGEYGKDADNHNKMHSTTCSWVALKEK